MNKMKEVAELLGLKVGDSFTIDKLGYGRSPFTFTITGIVTGKQIGRAHV